MKVYIKKGESEQIVIHYVMTLIILTIIVLGAFLGISNSNFDLDFDYIFSDIEIFIDFITRYSMSFLTALVFGSIPLFIYGAIVFLFIKPPKDFKAKLVSKKIETYNGQEITYMKFKIMNKNNVSTATPLQYRCYTYGKNDLIENNFYLIKVKEFNWKIKSVYELEKDFENRLTKVSLFVPFLFIFIYFGGGLLMASLRLHYCIFKGLPWLDNLPAIVIFSIFVLTDIWVYRNSKESNTK